MSATNRLKIIIYGAEADYKSAADLALAFQRIADDEVDMSKRYGDYSYTFELPLTKNNGRIFQNITAKGSKNIFNRNRDLPCQVFNNDSLLLDGVISLQEVTQTGYACIFYSKLKEFSDLIANKTLQELQFPVITWNYEQSIINHINSGFTSSDETYWQFPFIYYGTYFTPFDTYKNRQDFRNIYFENEVYPYEEFYYCMNDVNGNTPNHFYHHQFPPAFYIVSIINQIFKDAGWSLSGQFWNNDNIKKIVQCFAGGDDIYDRAIAASASAYDEAGGILSTSGLTTPLYPARLLPDMEQTEWLNGIMNFFCLYPIVDVENKSIKLETYKTLFGDAFNPYDITKKVKKDTAKFVFNENNNPTIYFQDAENFKIMGDNCISSGDTTNASQMYWQTVTDVNHDAVFNHRGITSEIQVPFSPPVMKKTYLWNDDNIGGSVGGAGAHVIMHPFMSSQTTKDSKKFCGTTGQTFVFNNEGYLKFGGKPTLQYYYGQSHAGFVNKVGKGAASTFYYVNMFVGGVQHKVPIGFCSAFQNMTYRDNIDAYSLNPDSLNDSELISATYLRCIYNMMSSGVTTDYSLTFGESNLHQTLWSYFHKPKYDRFKYSEILEADMNMSEFDWQEMQLNRPILYNDEIYHIVSLENYNPITRTASIRIIKIL